MKALALLSGGLDSTLAVKIVLHQGIEVIAVNFSTPFCLCNRRGCKSEAKKVTQKFNIPLKVISLIEEYIEIVKNPKYGYGKNLNPCIDCRILMFKHAKKLMQELRASFIITGEVLGQRPMSQYLNALKIIERESGLEGLVLRPLSAKLLPPSIPEKEGWVDREKLFGIRGRSRKIQMKLASEYGINDYPCSAGGCLLTDPQFSRRMRDLMSHSEITLNDIELLKLGRHFRLSSQVKIIVGRNEEENERLKSLIKQGDLYFEPVEVRGPSAMGRGIFSPEDIELASRIIARYCKNSTNGRVKIIKQIWPEGKRELILAQPIQENILQNFRI